MSEHETGPERPRLTPREILALADAITDLDGILERLSRMDIPTERYGMARGYLEEAQLDLDDELREVMLGEFRLLARALPAPPEAGYNPSSSNGGGISPPLRPSRPQPQPPTPQQGDTMKVSKDFEVAGRAAK